MLAELLTLERPLVCLDVETHDKVPPEKAHICELGFKIFYHDGRPPKIWESFIKPGVPIAPGAEEVHGISNADVADAPFFSAIAKNLASGFRDCDFLGYNVRFDLRVISAEMQRAGVQWTYEGARIIDPFRLWQVAVPRSLADAVREFAGREPTNSHRALADVEDAIDAAAGMLTRWGHLPKQLQELHDLCFSDTTRVDPDGKFIWNNGVACISFGKHAGTAIDRVDRSYLQWMATKGDFSPEVKRIATEALAGVYPKPKESK